MDDETGDRTMTEPARIVEPPMEPGWYRVRRFKERAQWSTARLTEGGAVQMIWNDGHVWLQPEDIAEWGESIDAVFAERDRLRGGQCDQCDEMLRQRSAVQAENAALRAAGIGLDAAALSRVIREATELRAERDRLATEVAAEFRRATAGVGDAIDAMRVKAMRNCGAFLGPYDAAFRDAMMLAAKVAREHGTHTVCANDTCPAAPGGPTT